MNTRPKMSEAPLGDRYLLVEQIGRGGMATVYEAIDSRIHKRVAVKLLNRQQIDKDEYQDCLARFRQEAIIGAQIRHQNIVDVTDFGTDDERAYLVMEMLDGESLGERLDRQNGPMPWREVVAIMRPVCDAVAFMHERGLIHRDIKPGNIFIVAPESRPGAVQTVKLLDLGISKILPEVARAFGEQAFETRHTHGTPATPEYMSPEQALGSVVDHRIDIYALGVTLYRMLTGDLPFSVPNARTTFAVQKMHVEVPPVSMRQLRPEAGIPAPIEAIVLRALAKRPEDRQESVRELAEALVAAEHMELGTPGPPPTPEDRTTAYVRPERSNLPSSRLFGVCTVLGGFMTAGTVFMLCMLAEIPGVQAFADTLRGSPTPPDHVEGIWQFQGPATGAIQSGGQAAVLTPEKHEEPVLTNPEPRMDSNLQGMQDPAEQLDGDGSVHMTPPDDEKVALPPSTRVRKPSSRPTKQKPKEPSTSPVEVKGQAEALVEARIRKSNCKQIIRQKVKLKIRISLDSGRIEARDEYNTQGGRCLCDALNRQPIKKLGTGVLEFDHWTSI